MVPAGGAPDRPAACGGAGPQVSASAPDAAATSQRSPPSGFSSWPRAANSGADRSPLRQLRGRRMAAGAFLEAGLARVLFYPTLLYTVFLEKMPGRAHRDWYHRIDATVLLGALPLRSMTRRVSGPGLGAGRAPARPGGPF